MKSPSCSSWMSLSSDLSWIDSESHSRESMVENVVTFNVGPLRKETIKVVWELCLLEVLV